MLENVIDTLIEKEEDFKSFLFTAENANELKPLLPIYREAKRQLLEDEEFLPKELRSQKEQPPPSIADELEDIFGNSGRLYLVTNEESTEFIGMVHIIEKSLHENTIKVKGLCINSKYRNKGYGKALLEKAIEEAKHATGAKHVVLMVYSSNKHALHLYESMSFRTYTQGMFL